MAGNPFKKAAKWLKKTAKGTNNVDESEIGWEGEMAHARLGMLYIFGNARVEPSLLSVWLSGTADMVAGSLSTIGGFEKSEGLKLGGAISKSVSYPITKIEGYAEDAYWKSEQELKKKPEERTLMTKIKDALKEFFKNLWAKLTEKVQTDPGLYFGLIKTVIGAFASMIAKALSPLGDALTIAKGAAQAIKAAWNRVDSWIASRHISFIKGHPTIIIDALNRCMVYSLGEGLWNVLKGSLSIGLEGVMAGAGKIAKLIMAAVEMLTKIIWRIVETVTIDKFCAEAKRYFQNRADVPFHEDQEGFARWFRKYAMAAPIIGVVALNCGYCGGPMHYLNMFNDTGEVITSSQFLKGTSFLSRLKQYGADYQSKAGFTFMSDDKVVNGALKAAKDYAKKTHIKHHSKLDWAYAALTS